MLEIDDPGRRERELYRLAGIEDSVKLEVGGTAVVAEPIEDEVARTSEDGKTSSIHFLRFPVAPAEAAAFHTPGARVLLGIDHPAYGHLAIMPEETRAALAQDWTTARPERRDLRTVQSGRRRLDAPEGGLPHPSLFAGQCDAAPAPPRNPADWQ